MDKVLKYLMENFPDNEPIFIKELEIESMPKTTLRVKIKELTDAGLLVRYSTGVYYLYTPNTDGVSHDISAEEIITKKYIKKNGVTTGYNSFNAFITQNREKSTFYIVSNAATSDHRVIKMDNFVIDIKKPKTVINDIVKSSSTAIWGEAEYIDQDNFGERVQEKNNYLLYVSGNQKSYYELNP